MDSKVPLSEHYINLKPYVFQLGIQWLQTLFHPTSCFFSCSPSRAQVYLPSRVLNLLCKSSPRARLEARYTNLVSGHTSTLLASLPMWPCPNILFLGLGFWTSKVHLHCLNYNSRLPKLMVTTLQMWSLQEQSCHRHWIKFLRSKKGGRWNISNNLILMKTPLNFQDKPTKKLRTNTS